MSTLDVVVGIIVVGGGIIPLTFIYKEWLVKRHRQKIVDKALKEYLDKYEGNKIK